VATPKKPRKAATKKTSSKVEDIEEDGDAEPKTPEVTPKKRAPKAKKKAAADETAEGAGMSIQNASSLHINNTNY